MFRVLKKFKFLLLGSLLIIPQISFAELAVRPMLPKGNLSNLGMTWNESYFSRMSWGAPYEMDDGEMRAYLDYWLFQGFDQIDTDERHESKGYYATPGFDYKLPIGYLSAGINQYSEKKERTKWADSDPDDYEENNEYNGRDIALQYIHEITEETTFGILLINKYFRHEKTESTATDKSGQGETSFLVYTLFSRIKLSELFSLGASLDSPVNQKIDMDGEYSNSPWNYGNGTRLNLALGIQNEKFGIEVAMHYEAEQAETYDGKTTGISLFGEFLIGDSLSLLFKFAQNNEEEVKYKGTKFDPWEHGFILYGAKLDTDIGTFAGDIRYNLTTNDDDDSYGTGFAQLSYVLGF
ncbi:MAG: hypothetical protein MI892_17000 [Desulfobacterales bacterium]|nr:hypothetical protein [Desulfobacterales bacterium]